jgi:cyclophilin family peptidyl-prolyl cis-trans isomerase
MRRVGLAGLILVGALAAGEGLIGLDTLAQSTQTGGAGLSLPAILALEDARAPTSSDLMLLIDALRGPHTLAAIQALGRLERRDVVYQLQPLLGDRKTRGQAAIALLLALRGGPLDSIPPSQQDAQVLNALIAAGTAELAAPVDPRVDALQSISLALGHFPYASSGQFRAAEQFLRQVLAKPFPQLADSPRGGAARGLESLARANRKLGTLDEETIRLLRAEASTTNPRRAAIQRNALAALVATQGVDADTLKVALGAGDMEVRRLAMLALSGAGSAIEDDDRIAYLRRGLSDEAPMVRVEALRAWVRRAVATHGCAALTNALQDQNTHVVLAALDALGDQCRADEAITVLITSEARTPKPLGPWQREAHAFVALAKRDPQRAALGLPTFATHQIWQVRMYAARAAAILEDREMLARLAADPDDNVVEAALAPLRRLAGADSDSAFIAALKRINRTDMGKAPVRPYQVIRAAALALDGAAGTPDLVRALIGALERTSADRCETSRDARLAVIARLAKMGSPANEATLAPLLKDIDPVVARAAADVMTQWTGRQAEIDSPLRAAGAPPSTSNVSKRLRAVFEMGGGGTFEVGFDSDIAPLSRLRFLAAALDGYYDDLTFHRVVPNFVIQGGSPGANEYCGECPFMRDELGGLHTRGTIGISTRGRDTGDAQIFVNLVDNPRLDLDYTVFARVCGDGMEVVDAIKEGDRIARVKIFPATSTCGG